MCNICPVKAGLLLRIILRSERWGRAAGWAEAQQPRAHSIHEGRSGDLCAERGLFLQGPNMLRGAGQRDRGRAAPLTPRGLGQRLAGLGGGPEGAPAAGG